MGRGFVYFSTSSYPQIGSILIGVFALGVVAMTVWRLIKGRMEVSRVPQPAWTARHDDAVA